MKAFKVPACLEDYLRSKTRPPFSLPGALPSALPGPSRTPGSGDILESILTAARENRPVELSADDSGDAITAAAILLALATRLGTPAPRRQGDLFDAAPALEPLRVHVGRSGVALPDRGTRPVVSPPDGLSLSGMALAILDAAARAGSLDYPSDFVAFDLETTGRDPWADEIIEIGAVKFLGGVEAGTHSTFVKPCGPIPAEIVEMTHISMETVVDAPPAPVAVSGFLEFCGGLPLVAHNAPFDLAFLRQQAMLGLGRGVGNVAEDTLVMARWRYPDAPGHRLGDLARLLGVALENWHRAASDARTAAMIYLALTNAGAETLHALRVLEHLDLAALGTIASGLPLEGENEFLVKHGIRMMARSFCLAGCSRAARMDSAVPPRLVAEMLLSLDDRVKQRAALHVLSEVVTSR
jgi:DNA polymerase III epsilon subunit family exonuclease